MATRRMESGNLSASDRNRIPDKLFDARSIALRLMTDPSIKDFEGAIAELETIVKKLEEGDLPLEQSLALYERGVQLSRFCHARLEEAEHRIEILNERGELKPAPASFAADESDRG
jgi:exodeoxyribonuclease VII small subunit